MLRNNKIFLLPIVLIFVLVFTNQALAQNTNQSSNTNAVNTNKNINTNVNANTNKVSKWEQELEEITDVGLLPDSPFYFLKTWWEEIQLFFTFDNVKKAEQQTKLATKRVVEAKKLVEKGKTEKAQKHLEKFQARIQKAVEKMEKAKNQGKNVEELVEKLKANNIGQQEVLTEVYEKVPDKAKESILKAMENSTKGLENAIENVQKSGKAQEFKAELKNRIGDFNLNKAQEVKEKLEARGVFR